MRKLPVLLAVVLTLSVLLFSMVPAARAQISMGVIGGVNFAKLIIDPDGGAVPSSHEALGLGGLLEYGLGQHLAILVQPMYLQKGTARIMGGGPVPTLPGIGTRIVSEIRLAYLEVPMMIKYAFDASNMKLHFLGGPSIGFNLRAKFDDNTSARGAETDIKDQIKSTDVGLAFGAGTTFPIQNNSLFLEFRYSFGLTDVSDIPDVSYKTKGIQILAGFMIPLSNL